MSCKRHHAEVDRDGGAGVEAENTPPPLQENSDKRISSVGA